MYNSMQAAPIEVVVNSLLPLWSSTRVALVSIQNTKAVLHYHFNDVVDPSTLMATLIELIQSVPGDISASSGVHPKLAPSRDFHITAFGRGYEAVMSEIFTPKNGDRPQAPNAMLLFGPNAYFDFIQVFNLAYRGILPMFLAGFNKEYADTKDRDYDNMGLSSEYDTSKRNIKKVNYVKGNQRGQLYRYLVNGSLESLYACEGTV